MATLATLVLLPGAVIAAPETGHFRPHVDRLLTLTPTGEPSTGYSGIPSMTSDARLVVFQSRASDLVPGDTNGEENWAVGEDIFLTDTAIGVTERLSMGYDGSEPNERSSAPSITPDGRYVAFSSMATNLVPGDTNASQDAFRLDLQTGDLDLVSIGFGGSPADGHSAGPIMTPDGNTIVFSSQATNLAPAPNADGAYDVYVRDMAAGETEMLSSGIADVPTRGAPFGMDVSDDGRLVMFVDSSNVAVGTSLSPNYHVHIHDRETGVVERISTNDQGMDAEAPPGQLACPSASMSADGRFVAMRCSAPNLVPYDTNGSDDIFVKDTLTGRMERVSLADDGRDIAWGSNPQISPDGRYVAFFSNAEVYGSDRPETGVKPPDLYIHDRLAGVTDPIYQRTEPQTGAQWSAGDVALSPGAVLAAYVAPLVGISEGKPKNLYLQRRGEEVDVLGLEASRQGGMVEVSGLAALGPQVVSQADRGSGEGSVRSLGAELRDVRLVARPEREDLFVSVGVDSLELAKAQEPLPAGLRPEAIRYRVSFTLAGERHEVLVERGFDLLGEAPSFSLSRCAPSCTAVGSLEGGFGTAGESIRFAIPVSMLSAGAGEVSGVGADTARVDGGAETVLDTLSAADGTLPGTRVEVGVADPGTPESEVAFSSVTTADGAFTAELDAPGGPVRVWARACVDTVCTTRSIDLSV